MESERPPRKKRSFWRLRNLRRLSQILFLLFFGYLILHCHGAPALPEGWRIAGAVNPEILFLANPVTWVLTVIASRSLITKTVWFLLAFVALTVVFGRVFCGWVCPLGTCIDGAGRLLRPHRSELRSSRERRKQAASAAMKPLFSGRTKYYLLLGIALLALFGANVSGWMDPLAILMRGTTFALAPAAEQALESTMTPVSRIPVVGAIASPVHKWVRDTLMPPTPHSYGQAALHLVILAGVLALSRLQRRWWCHILCPLGAFYGLLGRVSPWKRQVAADQCTECAVCGNLCRMEAVPAGNAATTDSSECLRCMECGDVCPQKGIGFSFRPPTAETRSRTPDFSLSRRGVLTAIGASVAVLPVVKFKPFGRIAEGAPPIAPAVDEHLLRPPGARAEDNFLRLCIRCGECFRACPQNAIHPVLFQAGLEGLWTPAVVPRLGFCEPSCTLCSNVCPTTALKPLTPREKRRAVRLGKAEVNRSRCIPWVDNLECGVCEEVCPVSPKAIEMRRGGAGRGMGRGRGGDGGDQAPAPNIVTDRCTGCGICENKCPVDGAAAIRVIRTGETRHRLA
jgi:polyferredoxin